MYHKNKFSSIFIEKMFIAWRTWCWLCFSNFFLFIINCINRKIWVVRLYKVNGWMPALKSVDRLTIFNFLISSNRSARNNHENGQHCFLPDDCHLATNTVISLVCFFRLYSKTSSQLCYLFDFSGSIVSETVSNSTKIEKTLKTNCHLKFLAI